MGPVQQAREEGMQQGRQQGKQFGVELGLKFGSDALKLMPDLLKIQDLEALDAIHNGLESIDSIEELQEICRGYLANGGKKH